MNVISSDKRHLFWSADINLLDLEKHKKYIIHQVLQYGNLLDLKWLENIYSKNDVKKVFIDQPRRTYQAKTFHFIKEYILKITTPLDSRLYVSTIS